MSIIQLLNFDVKGDDRGNLVALESMKNIPFEIKRVYYIRSLSSLYPRGFHAHKQLKQVAVCLSGSCRFILDDGSSKEEVWLKSASIGLVLPEMVWHEMHDFSNDCILLTLASDFYSEEDYLRDYDDFLKAVVYA